MAPKRSQSTRMPKGQQVPVPLPIEEREPPTRNCGLGPVLEVSWNRLTPDPAMSDSYFLGNPTSYQESSNRRAVPRMMKSRQSLEGESGLTGLRRVSPCRLGDVIDQHEGQVIASVSRPFELKGLLADLGEEPESHIVLR
jgi:hypothetical protein